MDEKKPLYQDRDWMYEQYVVQGKTALAISKMCGVHAVTIGKWLRVHRIPIQGQHMKTLEERFWEKIKKAGSSECWEWVAYKDIGGYGIIAVNKITQKAHRVSWILHYGEIPDGMFVLHKCDNPACVNPDHLFLGTQQENIQDMVNKKRHSRHESHRSAKLTRQDVKDIIELRRQKISMRKIADMYNITNCTVHSICQGIAWREVTENNVDDIKNMHLGHKFDTAKLPQVIELVQTDKTTKEIAEQFGVSDRELTHIIQTQILTDDSLDSETIKLIKRKRTRLYITEEMVKKIMADFASGMSKRAIQRKFGLSSSFIHKLFAGQVWRHVTKFNKRPYNCQIPAEQQKSMLQLRKEGKTLKEISVIFGVSTTTVSTICKTIKKPPAKAEG